MEPSSPTPVAPVPMPFGIRVALSAYIGLVKLSLLTALILLWPVGEPPRIALPLDLRFLMLAAVAGALGSSIHLASSFVEHAAQGRLHDRWALWYLLRPFIGATLAVLVYLLLRGGLIAGSSTAATESLNPYGITGLAGLAGLFSRQAMHKLKETFEHLCATRPEPPSPSGGE